MRPLDRLRRLLPPRAPALGDADLDARRDGLAMLASVVVAFVLWFTFSMRAVYSVAVSLPVEVAVLPAEQALRTAPPDRVTVQLLGEGWDLLALTRNPPTLRLRADGSTLDVLAAVGEAGLPSGISVQGARPRLLDLQLEERVERTVPIALRARLRVPAPFGLLGPPRLAPDSVRVSGARSLVESLVAWPTEPLVRDDVRRSFAETVALRDTLGKLVRRSVATTAVTVNVAEFTEAERMLPVRVENVPLGVAGVRLVPDRVRVTYRVPLEGPSFSRAESAPDFFAVVDYADIARDTTGAVPITVRLPAGLDLRDVRATPPRVEYFIRTQ